MKRLALAAMIVALAGAVPALAQQCPGHAHVTAVTQAGNVRTVHCGCDDGYRSHNGQCERDGEADRDALVAPKAVSRLKAIRDPKDRNEERKCLACGRKAITWLQLHVPGGRAGPHLSGRLRSYVAEACSAFDECTASLGGCGSTCGRILCAGLYTENVKRPGAGFDAVAQSLIDAPPACKAVLP